MMSNERGGIVTGWLLKLIVSIALFGFVAFEAGAIVVAKVTIENTASDAAVDAAEAYGRSGDIDDARQAARDVAKRDGAVLERLALADDGKAIVVTVSKQARTLLLQRIGGAKKWTVARATRRRPVT